MKRNQLVMLGVTSLFASGLAISQVAPGVSENLPSSTVNSASPSAESSVAQARPSAMSGTFVAAEKPTAGTARIVTENGQRFLVLNEAFNTSDQGPDLHVLLDTTQKPPMTYKTHGGYVNLGKLQKFNGTQRYPIPNSINLANYKSVVIWCRMANATFGYAPLGGSGRAAR